MAEPDEFAPPTRAPLSGVRPSSARALLLVVLGEFVWPSVRPVWSSTLLAALAEFDIEPNAARKALQRTAVTGLMETTRQGRRARWQITRAGFSLFSTGYEQVYGWGARDRSWDGQWFVLSATVPESQRRVRHHLQTRLTWAGLGSPAPGEWLTPHWQRGEQVARIIRDLGLEDQAHSFIGQLGPVGDESRLVRAAWNLDALAQDYREFIATYSALAPGTDQECLRARVALAQAWRRFPYLDPDLPPQFLPPTWPGEEASRVFRDRHNAWSARSARYWKRLEAATRDSAA